MQTYREPISLLNLLLITASMFWSLDINAQVINYLIYDGQQYGRDKIEAATRSPVIATLPRLQQNGIYVVSRSADGHYYIPGFVNGYPIVFLVDTGATYSVIPAKLARNAGIRAAVVEVMETASGQARTGLSKGNKLTVGAFNITDAKVGIQENLSTPILGMDVLNRFQLTYANGIMAFRPAQ